MPRYIFDKETGERVEQKGIPNLCWNWISPQPKIRAWRHACGVTMKLLPTNLDQKAEYWLCMTCKHKITLEDAQNALNDIITQLKQDCNLKTLEYIRDKDSWLILSNEFVGDSRLEAHRRTLSNDIKQDIVFEILDRLEAKLGVEYLDSMKHFYIGYD